MRMLDYQPIDPPAAQAIVVTASRTEEEQADTAASTTIIGGDVIERIGEPLTLNYLRLTPSAAISVSGTPGSQAQLRIRGAEANHTLLFVDGIRANDPAAGNEPRFELLNADLTSRIEVARGPQSALWGSEAIGGVVAVDGAIKTKPTVLGEFGSQEHYRGAGSAGIQAGRLTIALGAGVQGSEGIDAFDTAGKGDRDGYWNASLRGRAALSLGGGTEVGVNGFAIRANNDFDGFSAVTFGHDDTLDNTKNRLAAGRIWFAHKNDRWDARVAASSLGSSNRNYLDDTFLNRTSATRRSLSGQLSRRFGASTIQHRLTGAVEGEWERYRAQDDAFGGGTNQRRSRNHLSVTGEWQMEVGRWLVTDIAVRHDRFNRFKNATTARASALVRMSPRLSAAASWGEGIAQPTFTDLYGFFPNGYVGNPALKPERSRGYEVSLRYAHGPLKGSLTYFNQRLKDEIVENASFTSTLNASGTSKRRGVEAELSWSAGEWLNLSMGYTWLDATQQVDDSQAPTREFRRPKHSGFASVDGTRGRLKYGASLAYTGSHLDRRDSFPFELVNLDPYWLASARLGWRINGQSELFGRVHNAFDTDYEDVVGYRTPGRTAFAGIRVALGS
jgi:vitamin B12 transporter